MRVKIYFLLALITFLPFLAIGQGRGQTTIKAKELERLALKQRMMKMRLDTAISLSERELFSEANDVFISLLDEMDEIPSNLVYHFGKNSFYLGKYTQSIDWLNKYIELKGTRGRFATDAVALLKKAEAKLLQVKKGRQITQGGTSSSSRRNQIECGSVGKIICPVCKGSTVIVTREYTREVYKSCSYCHDIGYMDCEEYNKIAHGEYQKEETK